MWRVKISPAHNRHAPRVALRICWRQSQWEKVCPHVYLPARQIRDFARAGFATCRKPIFLLRSAMPALPAAVCLMGVAGAGATQSDGMGRSALPAGATKAGYAPTATLEGLEGVTLQLEQDCVIVGDHLFLDGSRFTEGPVRGRDILPPALAVFLCDHAHAPVHPLPRCKSGKRPGHGPGSRGAHSVLTAAGSLRAVNTTNGEH